MQHPTIERRYDIDWLRSLAFLILILYHIGMYYVQDWSWHIKSEHTYRWLQELMVLSNTWRMSLLFFISSMALSLIEKRYSAAILVALRSSRLLVPLVFGMLIIVAPQVYVEAISKNLITPGFVDFWLQYVNPQTELLKEHQSIIGLITWNHLWFLPYLWVYSLIVLLIRPLLARCIRSGFLQRLPFSLAVIAVVSGLLVIYLCLRLEFPTTHGFIDDWYNHAKYFLIFLFGYVFAQHPTWWKNTIEYRGKWLVLALLSYIFIVADRNEAFFWLAEQYETSLFVQGIYGTIFILNLLSWILAVVGYAGRYLRFNSPFLRYTNKAILPWYILHQTLIVVFAWLLKPLNIPGALEFMILLTMTIVGCALGYEIAKRFSLSRWLMGLRV